MNEKEFDGWFARVLKTVTKAEKKKNKMNGWVKLAELSNGVSICRHIKKDYIAHFSLN